MAWVNRGHFFRIAARIMRRILVDHARRRHAFKRDAEPLRLAASGVEPIDRAPELVALDAALTSLETVDPQQARVVELRFFGGLTVEETAEATGISTATVKREWRSARAWLRREIDLSA